MRVDELSLFGHSPFDRLLKRFNLDSPTPRLVGLFVMLTWIPLLLLSSFEETPDVRVTFFQDFPVHLRLLVAMTLLVVGERSIEKRLNAVIPILTERAMLTERSRSQVARTVAMIRVLANSVITDIVILSAALLIVGSQVILDLSPQIASWRTSGSAGGVTTFWYRWVSLGSYHFLLLRWVWRYFLWCFFLLQLSRADLALQGHHPDKLGGLGFLASVHVEFGLLATAGSIVAAANVGALVLYGGQRLDDFNFRIATYLVMATIIYTAPLYFFTPRLVLLKRETLRVLGGFGSRHAIEFDRRWSGTTGVSGGNPLGDNDICTLCDLGSSYDHLYEMRLVLATRRYLQALIAYIAVPFLPLPLVNIPLFDLLKWIVGTIR